MVKNLAFFLFLLLTFYTNGQSKKPDFQSQIDSILIVKPTTYKGINSFLRPFRKDTTKLNFNPKI